MNTTLYFWRSQNEIKLNDYHPITRCA